MICRSRRHKRGASVGAVRFNVLSPDYRRMEVPLKPFARSFAMATGLALLLTITPSWGQPTCHCPGCSPTVSDASMSSARGRGFA